MNQESNHFTFIITSYNCEKWVESNLNSILSQNYENYDIVYIDDASTDYTFEKAKQVLEIANFPEDRMKVTRNSLLQAIARDRW